MKENRLSIRKKTYSFSVFVIDWVFLIIIFPLVVLRYAVWYSGYPLRKKRSRVSSPAEDRQFSFLHRWYWKINISLPWNSTKESSIRMSITSTSYRQEDDLLLSNQNAQIPHRENRRTSDSPLWPVHQIQGVGSSDLFLPQTSSAWVFFLSHVCKKAGVENHNTPYCLSYPYRMFMVLIPDTLSSCLTTESRLYSVK